MIVTIVGTFIEDLPGPSVLMRWFEPAGWLRLAAGHRVGAAQLVPSMLALLLQQPVEEHDLSELGYISVGAAPLPAAVRAEWERRVPGAALLEGYGCTESGAVISSSTLEDHRSGSVGRPLPRYQVRVVDDAGRDVPAGSDGEIWVRGPGVMAGYWNDPETTAATLDGGWLHTGDVGHLDADGFLWLVDRKKDLIIRSGVNVFPRDVEEVLLEHPGVAAAAVVGRPDPVRGEEVVAFVAPRPGAVLDPAEVEAFAAGRLSGIHRPHDVRVLDAIRSPAWARPTARPCGPACSHPDPAGGQPPGGSRAMMGRWAILRTATSSKAGGHPGSGRRGPACGSGRPGWGAAAGGPPGSPRAWPRSSRSRRCSATPPKRRWPRRPRRRRPSRCRCRNPSCRPPRRRCRRPAR